MTPSSRAWSRLASTPSTAMTSPRPSATAVSTAAMPDAAEPDDQHGLARLRRGGVEQRAAAGQHRAPEDGGDVGRHVVLDRDDRPDVDDGVRRERGDPEVVVDRRAVAGQPAATAEQLAGAVAHRAGTARHPAVGGAAGALAAAGQEGHDDPLARPRGCRRPAPSASTRPLASWPSSIGTGRARLPSTTDRSEWHTPAASMRTSTSPGPGSSRSSSPTVSGRVRGPRRRTADLLEDGSGDPHDRASTARERTSRIAAGIGTVLLVVRSM